jgi:hypothetical protein
VSRCFHLLQLANEEANDIAVKMFNSIQIFNGITTSGGFEVPDDPGPLSGTL